MALGLNAMAAIYCVFILQSPCDILCTHCTTDWL